MKKFAEEVEERNALLPAEPWPEAERTKAKRDARIRAASKSFWNFHRAYFPADMYSGGYFPPNRMMLDKVKLWNIPGVQVVPGPRMHGKTVTDKQVMVWEQLHYLTPILGTYSSTLPISENILADLVALIRDNPRIMDDYGVEFAECNAEQYQFRTALHRRWCYGAAFSEGRSVRGFSKLFGRPKKILADDIETLNSHMGEKQVKERIAKVGEAYLSLTEDGTVMWNANNFDERCAVNLLLKEQEQGILNPNWHVHLYDAWDEKKNRPLWHERYTASTEQELMILCRAKDLSDWMGNFRQRPLPPDGEIFPRVFFATCDAIPDDALGVIFADPNLAKKARGDRTAIIVYFYSPSTDCFYVADFILRSFSDSNELLSEVLRLRSKYPGKVFRIGFDGQVNQESTWSNNVRNYCRIHNIPFPRIEYQRIPTDLFTKNLQGPYAERRVLFPAWMQETPEGQAAMTQLFTYAGKSANLPDDFPDGLVNAHELICGTGFVRPRRTDERSGSLIEVVSSIADYYQF